MAKLKTYQIEGMPERLQKAIWEADISQKRLADLIGRERKCISNWLRAETTPSATDVAKICKVLNISADYLLGLERK